MKKILCLTLCAILLISFSACGKKTTENNIANDVKNETVSEKAPSSEATEKPLSKEGSSFVGNWVIEKAEYSTPEDPMVSAMASILKARFAEGMAIEFKKDSTATVGNAETEFSVEDDLLTISWEKNKSFIFKTSGKGDKIDLVIDNVLNATIVKK